MAKKKTTKADRIRAYLKQNPGATPHRVAQDLKKHGVDVQNVYNTRLSDRKKNIKKKAKKKTATRTAKSNGTTQMLDAAKLKAAKEFSQQFESSQEATEYVSIYAELTK